MEQIFTLGEQETKHQLACTLRHTFKRMRKVKNNGAILIIVWNILLLSVYSYLLIYIANGSIHGTITWGLTLPLVGWLINIYVRRYKVIKINGAYGSCGLPPCWQH